jgi:hypothetical protein
MVIKQIKTNLEYLKEGMPALKKVKLSKTNKTLDRVAV